MFETIIYICALGAVDVSGAIVIGSAKKQFIV